MAAELKKNQIIELEITDIGVNGEGIGKYEGCTFFVKDAVIGDSVKAVITLMKKGYGFAKMLEVSFFLQDRCAVSERKTLRRLSDHGDEL